MLESRYIFQDSLRYRGSGELPNHSAEFVVSVETGSMVEYPQPPFLVDDTVTCFSVGIVDGEVEYAYSHKFLRVSTVVSEFKVLLSPHRGDVNLYCAFTKGTVTNYGRGNEAPSQSPRY